MRPAAEADVRDGLGDLLEINLALAQQVRVVLQMEFADAVLAKPTDFFVDIEAVMERVADVVINQHGLRLRVVEDARVVLGRNRVLQAEDHAGLLRLRSDFLQKIADVIHLRLRLERAFAEERKQDDARAELPGQGDGFGHPFLA